MQAQGEGVVHSSTRQMILYSLWPVGVEVRPEVIMELMVKQEQVEQAVEDFTPLKPVLAEQQVNRDSVIASLLVTMEGWGQAGWDRVVRELVLNTGRGEDRALRDGLVVELVE